MHACPVRGHHGAMPKSPDELDKLADTFKASIDAWASCLRKAMQDSSVNKEAYYHAQQHELLLFRIVQGSILGTSAEVYTARVNDVASQN